MKKIILIILCFFTFFVSFSQKKTNTVVNSQPNAFKIISKVLENISEDDRGSRKIEGGHRTGIYNGRSEFNFLIFDFGLIKLEVVTSLYVNGSMRRQREQYSGLTNYKFINSGGVYGTKIITADWDGYSAKFMMKLTDDQGVDEVYVSIKGESNWEHFTRISVNETQFQELVNTLSVSKIPQNVEKQKVIKLKEITLLETQEKIRKENVPKDNKDYLKIIGRPIKIGNLLVAQYSFPDELSWENAKKACDSLGKGWRLPTQVELNILYLNKKKIGGFADDVYWSSKEEAGWSGNYTSAWGQDFYTNTKSDGNKTNPNYVRAVRAF
jgi:hypothetical protein